ncbi:MAG: zinc ABC transporter substrate-binding protein [Mucinivorans sp.]
MKNILLSSLLLLLLCGCGPAKVLDSRAVVVVSIAPLGWLVEQIADTTVLVNVLVPETTSPETYEPTMDRMRSLSVSKAYISTGLIDFEQQIEQRIVELAPQSQYVDLSLDLEFVESTCSHHDANHHHGADPHIWLSPRMMRHMGEKVATVLCQINPKLSELYLKNVANLSHTLDSLDKALTIRFDSLPTKSFAIVHPSLTYFARDYSLIQVPIEIEGKEPGARQLQQIIEQIQRECIHTVFYSTQTSDAVARVVCKATSVKMVMYDPLSENWMQNIEYISDAIVKGATQN